MDKVQKPSDFFSCVLFHVTSQPEARGLTYTKYLYSAQICLSP
jgi:hypothetical protein